MTKKTASASKMQVHVLWGGKALCGKFAGIQIREWPDGHIWCRMTNRHFASCLECCRIADEKSKAEGSR